MAVKKTTEKTRTHFAYRIDTWTKPKAEEIVEYVAGVEDYDIALATFRGLLRTLAHHTAAPGNARN